MDQAIQLILEEETSAVRGRCGHIVRARELFESSRDGVRGGGCVVASNLRGKNKSPNDTRIESNGVFVWPRIPAA